MKTFLRDGSIKIYSSREGFGTPPGIEDYPFQGLAIKTEPYAHDTWRGLARLCAVNARMEGRPIPEHNRAGDLKYRSRSRTPLGTSVASLAREGGDMLAASCGNCQQPLAACRGLCVGGLV